MLLQMLGTKKIMFPDFIISFFFFKVAVIYFFSPEIVDSKIYDCTHKRLA